MIRALMLCIALSLPAAAYAQGPNTPRPEETKVFHACLKKAGMGFNDRVQCIGKVFEYCSSKPDQQTTMGMRECYSRESILWERMMNGAIKRLDVQQNKNTQTELREADRSWKAFRNTACNIPFTMYQKGTIGPVLGIECFNRTTALWAIQLDEFATPLGN